MDAVAVLSSHFRELNKCFPSVLVNYLCSLLFIGFAGLG